MLSKLRRPVKIPSELGKTWAAYTRSRSGKSECMWEGQTRRCWRRGKKREGRAREICVGRSNSNGESDRSEKRQVEMGKDSSEEERYLFFFWQGLAGWLVITFLTGNGYLVVVSLVHTLLIWLAGWMWV